MRPCIFQPGNTCWGSEGVKYDHVLRPSHHMLLELSFNNLASLSYCTIKFHLPSSCLKTVPSHASGTQVWTNRPASASFESFIHLIPSSAHWETRQPVQVVFTSWDRFSRTSVWDINHDSQHSHRATCTSNHIHTGLPAWLTIFTQGYLHNWPYSHRATAWWTVFTQGYLHDCPYSHRATCMTDHIHTGLSA